MGFNSTLVIMNDSLHEIAKDKNFGKKVSDAVQRVDHEKYVDISSGCCGNAATVVDCHHADGTALIAVGGNCATVLMPYAGSYRHHTKEGQERMLRAWADELGFRVAKKPKRK